MYEELKAQGERISKLEEAKKLHDECIQMNKEAIAKLQKVDLETESVLNKQEQRIVKLESNYLNLENTIMKENRETRQAYEAQTDRQWSFIEQVTGFKENESKRKHDFKMHKFNQVSGILLKALGAGGIAYLLIQDWLLTR